MPSRIARQLIVGPVAGAGVRVGRDVGRNHPPGKAFHGDVLAGAAHARLDRRIVLGPTVRRMTFHASRDVIDQIVAAGQAFWGGRKSSRRERARTRTDKRPPADGEGNPHGQNHDQRHEQPDEDLPDLPHGSGFSYSRD